MSNKTTELNERTVHLTFNSCPNCKSKNFHRTADEHSFFKGISYYEEYCDDCGYALVGSTDSSGNFNESCFCKGNGEIRYRRKNSKEWKTFPFDSPVKTEKEARRKFDSFFKKKPSYHHDGYIWELLWFDRKLGMLVKLI